MEIDFRKCPVKRKTQYRFYKEAAALLGPVNATILAGPQLRSNISLASLIASKPAKKIVSYELDREIYNEQLQKFEELPHHLQYKTKLLYGSIEQADPTPFIDADLMGTMRSQAPIIETLYYKQGSLPGHKILQITASVRKCGVKETLQYLSSVIGSRIIQLDTRGNGICTTYELFSEHHGRIKAFAYNENGPMMVFQIIH